MAKEENRLNIVLMQPQIPQNTGNIVRTCAAINGRLHLVKPMGFPLEDKQLKRAGLDYWQHMDLTVYESTEDFFLNNKGGKFYYFTTKARQNYTQVNYPKGAYLVFGREDKGIDEEILKENKEYCVRLPMSTGIRSLNLANTVAIGVYEVLRQWDFPKLESEGTLHEYTWED